MGDIDEDTLKGVQHLSIVSNDFEELKELNGDNPMGPGAKFSHVNHDIEMLLQGVYVINFEQVFECTQMIRRLVTKNNSLVDKLITLNGVSRLVNLLQHDELPDIEFEAAWALGNIAAGSSDQTECVVNAGSIPHFLRLLESPVEKVAEQAVWALANIAGDCPRYRDKLINMGIIHSITFLVNSDVSESFLANVAWCLSNLCRHRDPPMCISAVRGCLRNIRQLLFHDDPAVFSDACWALYFITDITDDRIQEVIDLDVIDRLIAILQSSNDRNLVLPTIQTFGKILTGTDEQAQVVIDHGGLAAFKHILQHPSLNLYKEVAWALSNVTAGSIEQIQAVIDNGLLSHLITLLDSSDEKIRNEATWAIYNLAHNGTFEQIITLVRYGGFPPLIRMSSSPDSEIKQIVLSACRQILNAWTKIKEEELLLNVIKESEIFFHHLERLKEDNDEEIRSLVTIILEEFSESLDDDYVLLSPFEPGFK